MANTISKYDDLTRLPNRRFFINTIHDLSYTSLGLILIDIDHFKNINDTYGHVKGLRKLYTYKNWWGGICRYGKKCDP